MRWRDSTALYIETPLFNIHTCMIHHTVLLERVKIRILPAGRTPPSLIKGTGRFGHGFIYVVLCVIYNNIMH